MTEFVVEDFLGTLTSVRAKAEAFRHESFVRESWTDAVALFGHDAAAVLCRIALVTLKPEAIAARRGPRIVEALCSRGFRILGTRRIRYNRHSIQALWRMQWNIATLDRLALYEHLYCKDDSLVLVVTHEDTALPAAVNLRNHKGAARPERRRPESVRAEVDAPTRVLTLFHATDEPIDVVRELGILFPRIHRRRLLAEMVANLSDDLPMSIARDLKELHTQTPVITLDRDGAGLRLQERLASLPLMEARKAADAVTSVFTGETIRYVEWTDLLVQCGLATDDWDAMVLAGFAIDLDVPGARQLVDDDGASGWLETPRFESFANHFTRANDGRPR